MKKSLVAILAAAVFLLSSLGPAFYIQTVQATDPSDWYTIVNGVLTSDYYSLYPYNTLSIDFGLSKYGEMISYDPVTGIGVGLQYPGYDSVGTYDQTLGTSSDPFANEFIDPKLWLNGWLIDVRYTHRTLRDRRILAMAMFADMAAYGGEWIVGHPYPFNLAPHGGRKTTGYAETIYKCYTMDRADMWPYLLLTFMTGKTQTWMVLLSILMKHGQWLTLD